MIAALLFSLPLQVCWDRCEGTVVDFNAEAQEYRVEYRCDTDESPHARRGTGWISESYVHDCE